MVSGDAELRVFFAGGYESMNVEPMKALDEALAARFRFGHTRMLILIDWSELDAEERAARVWRWKLEGDDDAMNFAETYDLCLSLAATDINHPEHRVEIMRYVYSGEGLPQEARFTAERGAIIYEAFARITSSTCHGYGRDLHEAVTDLARKMLIESKRLVAISHENAVSALHAAADRQKFIEQAMAKLEETLAK